MTATLPPPSSHPHDFEPGGRVLSVWGDVDPRTVCRYCLLGRPAHEPPIILGPALSETLARAAASLRAQS